MTAHGQQAQRVVLVEPARVVLRFAPGSARGVRGRTFFAPPPRDVSAKLVGHSPASHLDQPAPRVVRYPQLGPLRDRGQERFLHCVFRARKVVEVTHQRGEHLRREFA
ncbi:MAG TPA: hypothetical protein VFU02_03340 [Polyangiaceae bacterium]|nr:hypothetical protein [Polyangiaceae bacterium]